MQTGITFENVAFSYDKSAHSVLQDVTLTIRPGEKIALVGSNGAGKTTLIKLLCRLYDPQGGRITLDGVDLRNYSPIDLRRQISVVLQDYGHYNLTALDNIWFGDTSQPRDEATITAAAAKSGADPVIAKLKNGYNTTLGKMFQQGEELSIGEWQKVALARAFFRDSQIVIMDEPTSSMDAQSEFEIFSRLRELTEGRSVILISHRFSTVRMADRIYVLDEGRIIEQGSHDELMAQRGLYARLFDAQASHYQ